MTVDAKTVGCIVLITREHDDSHKHAVGPVARVVFAPCCLCVVVASHGHGCKLHAMRHVGMQGVLE